MFLGSLFKPVKSITTDEVRKIIKDKNTEDYCLLDVRQPGEYAEKHIPGAKLIPLGELQAHLNDVDPKKPTIVYCRSGNRSRSAVGMLNGAGLEDVYNMEGGILAYNGLTAVGPPEAGVFCFPENMQPEELIAMAWYIEDGSQRFIQQIIKMEQDPESSELFAHLAEHKVSHKDSLVNLYKKITGADAVDGFPESVLPQPPAEVMAGCVSVPEALDWARDKLGADILELMMSLEANTWDLYLKLGRKVPSEQARSVFIELSEQEKQHLDDIATALEKTI